jgi:hypothetical protein
MHIGICFQSVRGDEIRLAGLCIPFAVAGGERSMHPAGFEETFVKVLELIRIGLFNGSGAKLRFRGTSPDSSYEKSMACDPQHSCFS